MSDKSKIEWTDATWNPTRGCSRVSDGCRNCYAERVAHRFSRPGQPYEGLTVATTQGPKWSGKVSLHPELLDQPLRWNKPRRIFVNSMSDLFHENVPDAFIDKVFAVMALARRHTFQVLTKRPERMRDYCAALTWERLIACCNQNAFGERHVPGAYNLSSINALSTKARFVAGEKTAYAALSKPPLPNVWLGVSVEDQTTADERIPLLLQTEAAVRFISAEPLLSSILLVNGLDISPLQGFGHIDWIIAGGESGPRARPSHPDWFRSLRDQCAAARVPFFFKQWGEWTPSAANAGSSGDGLMTRVGKKTAGRLLDGRTHDGFPHQWRGDVYAMPSTETPVSIELHTAAVAECSRTNS